MEKGLLEKGITSQGAASRGYDKYGKRRWMATPVKDMSKKDKGITGFSEGKSSPMGADSDTPRRKSA